ncbi:hypothetical protein [Halobacteriovorax sp. ZH5_bin.2]|uniref:hypothetical protein n=1 Tax=unclassified Halobacteriovorax TaxID=2639665 RepID=UPI0037227F04
MKTIKPPHKCGVIKSLIKYDLKETIYRSKMALSRRSASYISSVEWSVPKSEKVERIIALADKLYDGPLFNHGIRSYAFGKILMSLNNEKVDNEVFFIGSLLHDLGLIKDCTGTTFELVGADEACAHCHDILTPKQLDIIHEMILLHGAIGYAENKSLELKYLHYGAGVDVADLWRHRLNEQNYFEVYNKYPSQGHIPYMIDLLKKRMNENPNMYLSTVINLGFLGKMKQHKHCGQD